MGQMIKHKLGMRELVFDNVEIPEECLVGVEGKAMLCMVEVRDLY